MIPLKIRLHGQMSRTNASKSLIQEQDYFGEVSQIYEEKKPRIKVIICQFSAVPVLSGWTLMYIMNKCILHVQSGETFEFAYNTQILAYKQIEV